MAKWKEHLLQLAKRSQMCASYYESLSRCETKSDAINLYKREVNWAIEANYPSLDIIRHEFAHCEKDGIFVDKVFSGELFKKQLCYVLHHCSGRITVDIDTEGANIPMLYIANGCNLVIERAVTKDSIPIRVPLYIFGNNEIVAEDTGRVSFALFKRQTG